MHRFAMVLIIATALASQSYAGLVTNGSFESGTTGWTAYGKGTDSTFWTFQTPALGISGNAGRIRLNKTKNVTAIIYQVIQTEPGKTYTLTGSWKNPNETHAWCGAFFFNGGTLDVDQTANKALIDAFIPAAAGDSPFRRHGSSGTTELVLPPDKEIVIEHATDYGSPFLNWETFYDGAGGAGDPTTPGIGELAVDGGGAAWQTKVATGNTMIVGFFELDTPSDGGAASDLLLDNIDVTPEPASLLMLGLGAAAMLRRRR